MPWLLKGCPRCGGDLQYDDLDDLWDCVCCGWLSVPTALAYPIPAERHKGRVRTGKPGLVYMGSSESHPGASEGIFQGAPAK